MLNGAITPFTFILDRGALRRLGGASEEIRDCFAEVR
ncbi:hypothetical protein P3T22_003905 [Paraburkholderia sp. GAS348]